MRTAVALVLVAMTSSAYADTDDETPPTRSAPPIAPAPVVVSQSEVLATPLPAYTTDIPPLSGGRLAGELFAGGIAGLGGLYLGASIGSATCSDADREQFLECLGPVVVGALAGGVVGASIGVYAVGSAGDEGGSFMATLGGGVLGALGGIATQSEVGIIAGPILGAMIGFNLTRHWDVPRTRLSTGALVGVKDGKVSLGVPAISHGVARGATTTNVTLLGGSF